MFFELKVKEIKMNYIKNSNNLKYVYIYIYISNSIVLIKKQRHILNYI